MLMLTACSTSSGSAGLQTGNSGGDVRAGGDGAGAPPALDGGKQDSSGGQDYGQGFGDGGAAGPDGGGGGNLLGGGGAVNAAPLAPQSLIDDGQPHSIGPWGPVEYSQQVALPGGGTTTLTRLASVDPFTATWQLADGTIVVSNEPLTTIVARPAQEPPPATEQWTGPDNNTYTITAHRILAWFTSAATQQDIETFNAAHNLQVVMSWFEPPEEEGQGNAIAYFEYDYNPLEFPSFSAAYAFFNAQPLTLQAEPDVTDMFKGSYSTPNDKYFQSSNCLHVNAMNVVGCPAVGFGPPYTGTTFSNQVVAVIDDGVLRTCPEFRIGPAVGDPPSLWDNGNKISWVGINCFDRSYEVGDKVKHTGEPDTFETIGGSFRWSTHGTNCAGVISAKTNIPPFSPNSPGEGVASLCPRACILPVRMKVIGHEDSFIPVFSAGTFGKALRSLRFQFYHSSWTEFVRVVNMSFNSSGNPYPWNPNNDHLYNITQDLSRSDRLYIASAGNTAQSGYFYPAAYPNVLGVTGVWTNRTFTNWSATYAPPGKPARGSNYRVDSFTTYPVSGVFGITDGSMYSVCTPIYGQTPSPGDLGWYSDFQGTSACAPQVAGLACWLYTLQPASTYAAVRNRIKDPTKLRPGSGVGNQLAPVVDFNLALQGW